MEGITPWNRKLIRQTGTCRSKQTSGSYRKHQPGSSALPWSPFIWKQPLWKHSKQPEGINKDWRAWASGSACSSPFFPSSLQNSVGNYVAWRHLHQHSPRARETFPSQPSVCENTSVRWGRFPEPSPRTPSDSAGYLQVRIFKIGLLQILSAQEKWNCCGCSQNATKARRELCKHSGFLAYQSCVAWIYILLLEDLIWVPTGLLLVFVH